MPGDGGPPTRIPPLEATLGAEEEPEVSARPGDGALSRTDAVKDERVRRWDVATPSATLIGRPENPEDDLAGRLRRLHDEQHPAMRGHSARMHRLDKLRIAHSFCNELDLTPWERDRALGIMAELDLTAFGSRRAIPTVALVAIKHVVDEERQGRLGLGDREWISERPPEELEALYERYESITDDPRYRELLAANGLDTTAVNRLARTLREQLDEQGLDDVALGRSPYRDAALPPIRDRPDERGGAGPAVDADRPEFL